LPQQYNRNVATVLESLGLDSTTRHAEFKER
jgi:hypothetical protein